MKILEKISGRWASVSEIKGVNCNKCMFFKNDICENDGFECMYDKDGKFRSVVFQEREKLTFRDQKSTKNWNNFLNKSEIIKNETA